MARARFTRLRRVRWAGGYSDWEEVAIYEDFFLSERSPTGSHTPGKEFYLKVFGVPDPESGELTDVDGDKAAIRITLVGAEIEMVGGTVDIQGFVELEDIEHEKHYRAGDLDACVDTGPTGHYVREEWQLA